MEGFGFLPLETEPAGCETLKDKDFLTEAVKSRLDIDPLIDGKVEKIAAVLFKLEPALAAKMAEILK